MNKSRIRLLSMNAALLVLSSVIGIALLEVGLRLTGRFRTGTLHSVSDEDLMRVPGVWEPGQDLYSLANQDLPHRIRSNSLGLRGPEATRRPLQPRVLCLGDSFTFGDYVEDDETLPARIEAQLGGAVEVLNAGVGGTTVSDQRVFLERMLALEPDAVLLTYSENDLDDLILTPPMHVQMARNRGIKSGAVTGPLFRLVRNLRLFNAGQYLRARYKGDTVAGQGESMWNELSQGGHPERLDVLLAMYREEMAAIKEMLEARGVRLVWAAFPSYHTLQRSRKSDRIGPVLELVESMGIPAIDLTPVLRSSGHDIEDLYLLPYDGHPSALAYRVTAEYLAPYVGGPLLSSLETLDLASGELQ